MLDNNTNKVVWVGVAVGVVTLLGVGALQLFPQMFNTTNPMIHKNMLISSASPAKTIHKQDMTLTNESNGYFPLHAYVWEMPKETLKINSGAWAYFSADIVVDKAAKLKIDFSNYKEGQTVSNGTNNDNDDIKTRQFVITDSDGNDVVSHNDADVWNNPNHDIAMLEAGKKYHMQLIYENNSDITIYDGGVTHYKTTSLLFTPEGGAVDNNPLPIHVSNYKQNAY